MEHLLEMRNLSIDLYKGKKTPAVKLVEGIDLTLEKRQNFGVVGESGCGKSITCSSIMGLLSFPLSVGAGSSIRFQREDGSVSELTSLPKAEMRKIRGKEISMIFQEPMTSLNPIKTCGKQIMEPMFLHTSISKEEAKAKAVELLRLCGIPDPEQRFHEYPHQMSGGMRQRIMIAMALACNPKLLIADEPTTALDVTIQAQILELMKKLKDSHDMGIILITHDLGIVADFCDRVLIFYTGQIVESAPVRDLFREPLHPYTKGLIRALPKISEQTDRLEAIRPMV